MNKKLTLIMAFILPAMILGAQEETKVLDLVSAKMEEFRQAFPLEKVYVQTDKEVYAPGAIVWFSALVADRSENRLSDQSPEITVNLYDASGNFVAGDRYRVAGGLCEGDLQLPDELPLGRYFLAAYTPLQVNPGNVFIKPLVVDRCYESDALVTFSTPAGIYPSGQETGIELEVTDYTGKPADKFQLTWEARHGLKKLAGGKVRSDKGKAVVMVPLPAMTGTTPVELLVSHPKNLWSRKLSLMTSGDVLGLTFYPEGGSLIGTVPQKMGYYVTAREGVPVEIDADIVNGRGEVIAKTKTFAPGYGLFPFKGEAGEKYALVITSAYGKGQRFDLPATGGTGVALVVQKSDQEMITADLLAAPAAQPRKLSVTATRGATLLWAANLEIVSTSRIRIPVAELGSGLTQLSVFDDRAQPLSSRLVYIPGKQKLNLRVNGEPTGDGNVKISVEALDENQRPADAMLFLSVADKMRRIPAAVDFSTYMALDGELLHPVSHAVSSAALSQQGAGLDFVLIANELRCVSWKRILEAGEGNEGQLLNTMGLSGKVTDKKGAVIGGAKVSVMNLRDMQVHSAVAGPDGRFVFPALQPVDVTEFNISATDANGKGNYQVILDPTFTDMVGLKVRALDHGSQGREAPRGNLDDYLSANPGFLYPQPVIRPVAAGGSARQNENYKKLLQTSTSLLEVIKSMRPYSLVNGQIVFPGTVNSINFQSGALIVVDGQKMGTQADVLNSLSPFDVDKINISLDPIDIQKYTGLNNVGLIEITTKRGNSGVASPQQLPAVPEVTYSNGYRVPRDFLTTDALENQSGKDLRTTLYWDPSLKTGNQGARVFSVPLSEVRSGFVVRAEGFTGEMTTGSADSEFQVK